MTDGSRSSLADHWIRVAVVLGERIVARRIFPPGVSVRWGSAPHNDLVLDVPEPSVLAVSGGVNIHLLPGAQLRMRADDGDFRVTGFDGAGTVVATYPRLVVVVRRNFLLLVGYHVDFDDAQRAEIVSAAAVEQDAKPGAR